MNDNYNFYTGDIRNVLPNLRSKGKKYKAIITSPFYNRKVKYDNYDDNLTEREFMEFTDEWVRKAQYILEDDGFMFVNYGGGSENWFFTHDIAKRIVKNGFRMKTPIHWLRRNPAYHSHETNLGNHFEYIYPFTKDKNVEYPDRYAIGTTPVEDIKKYLSRNYKDRRMVNGYYIRDRGNFWIFQSDDLSTPWQRIPILESPVVMRNQSTLDSDKGWEKHPAAFPLVVAAALMMISTKKGDRVLDPFGGSGTTAMAAKLLERKCDIIDLSPNYISDAKDRLERSNETLPDFYPKPKKVKKGRSMI